MRRINRGATIPPDGYRLLAAVSILLCFSAFLVAEGFLAAVIYFLVFTCTTILSLAFWMHFFPYKFPRGSARIRHFFQGIFRNNPPFAVLSNANFDLDYFALRRKPHIPLLVVDNNSAVVIKTPDERRHVLCNDSFDLEPGTEICHIFERRPGLISLEPNSFSAGNPINPMQKILSCKTADGAQLTPLLKVYYRLQCNHDSVRAQRDFAALSHQLEKEKVQGLVTKPIESMIAEAVITAFAGIAESTNLRETGLASGDTGILIAHFQGLLDTPGSLLDSLMPEDVKKYQHILRVYTLRIVLRELWL